MPEFASYVRKLRTYWVTDASFVTLLFMLGFTIFILPTLLEQIIANPQTLHISLMAIFLVGIWSAFNRGLLVSALLLFTVSLVLNVICFFNDLAIFKTLLWASYSLNTLLFIITNLNLLFRDDKFNFHRVLGAINVYLLLGMLGAFLFELLHATFGASLQGAVELSSPDEDFAEYIYFSMVSISTVGYGEIQPANASARMLSVFLSTIGILYPAIVIAKLVSAATQQKSS